MKILYAGDSPAGGPANYLLGILRHCKAEVVHVPPSEKIPPSLSSKRFDAIILSDFSKKNLPAPAEKNIARQVRDGAGLLMVGGWGSFSGPFGGWRDSEIEELLPVRCSSGDDRLNFPSGAKLVFKKRHSVLQGLSSTDTPVICGINQVLPKAKAEIALTARRLRDNREFPLLVFSCEYRTAAFATDFAPHWCGGLVDWGKKSVRLPVAKGIQIEIGETYLQFASQLIRYLSLRTKQKFPKLVNLYFKSS